MIESNDHSPTLSLHYTLRFEDGTVFDGSEEHAPLQCRLGDGTLHPALERCLAGLATGSHETFHITPEQGFGPYDPEMVQALDRSQFDEDSMLEPGTMIAFETPTGDTLPGRVVSAEAECVLVDFNHPLAGRDFVFEVRILSRD